MNKSSTNQKKGLMNISNKNWIIINIIASFLFYIIFNKTGPKFGDPNILEWSLSFMGSNIILTICVIVWAAKGKPEPTDKSNFKIIGWLVAHWLITILSTIGNNWNSL